MYDLKTAEMIERLYCSDEINCYESFEDIELAFYNCDYYINPKSRNVKENFLLFSEYYEELNPKNRNAKDNFFLFSKYDEELFPEKEQAPVLYDDRLRAKLYLKVIKDQFDYDYFKERLEFHKQYNDPECLREWMCKLSIDQLKSFLPNVVKEQLVFTKDNNSFDSLCTNFNEACAIHGAEAPSVDGTSYGEGYYQIDNLETIFNCLDKETIVDIFCASLQGEYKYRAAVLAHEMYVFEFYVSALEPMMCIT